MDIPVLAPGRKWQDLSLTSDQRTALTSQLALIVGLDTKERVYRPLGTGILVSVKPSLHIITAAHVLWWFVHRIFGPAPRNSFSQPGPIEPGDMRNMDKVCKDQLLRAVIGFRNRPGSQLVELTAVGCSTDDKASDLAVLRGATQYAYEHDFEGLLLDVDAPTFREPYVMAGFADMPPIPFEQESRLLEMRQKLIVRAALIVEESYNADGARLGSKLWRVTMPSEPGMSGGPLIRIRRPQGPSTPSRPRIPVVLTAAGVVSRMKLGEVVGDVQEDDETWISPIGLIRNLSVPPDPQPFGFRIDAQVITYQDIEPTLAKLPQNFTERFSATYVPILRRKMQAAAQPAVTAFLELLPSTAGKILLDASELPFPKAWIKNSFELLIHTTPEGDYKKLLQSAYLSLSRWQEGVGFGPHATPLSDEMQTRMAEELAALALRLEESQESLKSQNPMSLISGDYTVSSDFYAIEHMGFEGGLVEFIFCENATESVHARGFLHSTKLPSFISQTRRIAAKLSKDGAQSLSVSVHEALSAEVRRGDSKDRILVLQLRDGQEAQISISTEIARRLRTSLKHQ